MAKKAFVKSQLHALQLLVAAFVLLVIGVLAVVITNSTSTEQSSIEPPAEGPIRIQGEVVCLPHKNTDGPQTLECAFGLKDKDGLYYALKDSRDDHSNITSIPTGKQVVVTGTLEHGEDSVYQTVGTIEVTDAAPPK